MHTQKQVVCRVLLVYLCLVHHSLHMLAVISFLLVAMAVVVVVLVVVVAVVVL